jgi:tetratricopeptide (TPR) repeat protein
LELKLDKAQSSAQRFKAIQNQNLAFDFIEDYIDIFKIYISDDKTLFKQLEKNEKLRVNKLSESKIQASPYIKYSQAEIHLHWALLHLKFGHYLSAFNKIKKAFNLLQANTKEYPSFVPNQKSLAVIHALLSTVPQEYKWIIKTMSGMSGDMDQARFELEQVILYSEKTDYLFKDEAILAYIVLVTNFDNDVSSALTILDRSHLNPATSPLISYVFAHLALKNFQNEKALDYLLKSPSGNEYYSFHYLDFLIGLSKLRRLDNDAHLYLQKYISKHKGLHFVKECYQKLAWAVLIKNNIKGYHHYMNLLKSNGTQVIDEDKQAHREAIQNHIPNVHLLKARLLFDGGYFSKAESIILANQYELDKSADTELEANYRLGRIYHQLNKFDKAILFYMKSYQQGIQHPAYFACASALYLGQVYEKLQKKDLSNYFFEKCLLVFPKEYSNSLHQKAKAGLNRIK